jgi:DNA-binding NtrC family response regulator
MTTKQKDLEEALIEKVSPLLEKSMEKNWGIVVPKIEEDITDKLKQNTLEIFIEWDLPFSLAKKAFKKEFLRKELLRHHGNISLVAKLLDINRRSIHRAIKELHIRIEKTNPAQKYIDFEHQENIKQTIKSTLDGYKDILRDDKMEKMYEELGSLSKSIASQLPHTDMSFKEAEKEFEREYFLHHLKKAKGNVTLVAKSSKLRIETVSRKISKLGLDRKEFL